MVLKGLRDLGGFLIEDFSGGVSFRLFYACPCMHLINGGSGVPSLGRLENFLLFSQSVDLLEFPQAIELFNASGHF